MNSIYAKRHYTFDEQLDLLERRGLRIGNRDEAKKALAWVGYYGFGAYLYPFRTITSEGRSDEFADGATFGDALALFWYDKELRHLFMEALELIERAVKVSVAYRLGDRDTFAHETGSMHSPSAFVSNSATKTSDFDAWLSKHRHQLKRNEVAHINEFAGRYGTPLPIWVAIEVMDFGDVSKLLGMVKRNHQRLIAHDFGISDGRIFASWIRTLCHVRNVCAHHGRLWNRELTDIPRQAKGKDAAVLRTICDDPSRWPKPYAALLICGHLLAHVDPESTWMKRMRRHLERFPETKWTSIDGVGAPPNWRADELWWRNDHSIHRVVARYFDRHSR